ncbi:FtsK/SpoIIIE domain-containing protein [uncultured Metabacillus sp.]|uniref:FtsK/SpoIIIE domain-containing protein n=1 Tax=uncultured Metabacillus sp. TaxID=2860135 RepID=UPI002607EFBF|nr:FtsK/SpoIIIE domain-containing protein [uncultured Metabacillus sp.]
MLLEIVGSIVAGGIVAYSSYQKSGGSSDTAKIQRICSANGLIVKENGQTKNMQLLRRTRHVWGVEYAYRIPLGLSFEDFQNKKNHLQDGLNNKRSVLDVTWEDLKQLKLSKRVFDDIKTLLNKKKRHRKEIELSYDGLLKIRVYNEPLTDIFAYSDELIKKCKGWEVPIGESRHGFIKYDFEKKAHIIVAGTTDFGKSNWVNSTINTLIKNQPENVSFTLIDLKGGLEFNQYKDLPQVGGRLAKNPEEALESLQAAVDKMDQTTEYLLANGFRNVKEAGYKERHFIVIDEAADIADDKNCQELLKDIARKGRAAGLRLIYTTQYPTAETISSQVKRNCIGRLCFVLDTATASTVVLDQGGAENLPLIQGRALYKDVKLIEVQTPYISSEKIRENIKPLINIRPRKEGVEKNGKVSPERTERRKYTPVFEETELS